jgi:hypothetical protein
VDPLISFLWNTLQGIGMNFAAANGSPHSSRMNGLAASPTDGWLCAYIVLQPTGGLFKVLLTGERFLWIQGN